MSYSNILRIGIQYSLSQYPSVIALVDHKGSIRYVEEIMRLFPDLLLVSTQSYILSSELLPELLQDITHLQMLAQLSYRDTQDICMPNLQTLSLI